MCSGSGGSGCARGRHACTECQPTPLSPFPSGQMIRPAPVRIGGPRTYAYDLRMSCSCNIPARVIVADAVCRRRSGPWVGCRSNCKRIIVLPPRMCWTARPKNVALTPATSPCAAITGWTDHHSRRLSERTRRHRVGQWPPQAAAQEPSGSARIR